MDGGLGSPTLASKKERIIGMSIVLIIVILLIIGCIQECNMPKTVSKITIYNEKREVVREYVGNWLVDEGTPYSPFIAVWGKEGEAKFPRSYSYEVTKVTLDRKR